MWENQRPHNVFQDIGREHIMVVPEANEDACTLLDSGINMWGPCEVTVEDDSQVFYCRDSLNGLLSDTNADGFQLAETLSGTQNNDLGLIWVQFKTILGKP